ncbi:hypothetical protein [Pontibacter mangrovi]|uniref:Uncharacterized protein n=1 Tax=Pontibacter mangrovi TaxID=2589816 RepID=A0A501WFX9_9BACT|nr:hypothetical protein [Pontibacter mangrovi]TPE45887.1 hypothetical protein FJM65_00650 [Pontibacter mangrovi]
MKPEDIDKLFKERLGNTAPTPPADLWSRLQERMEAEQEKPLVILTPEAEQKKEGKQRYMWVYSSVAATLSLLLAVGVVFYNIKSGTPEINETITKYDVKLPESRPDAAPILVPEPEAGTPESMMAQTEPAEENSSEQEKKSELQATEATNPASNLTKTPTKQQAVAMATTKPKATQQSGNAKATVKEATMEDAQTAIASNTNPATTAKEAAPVSASAALASANLNAEPVEIIIKRGVASSLTEPAGDEAPTGGRKKALAKNIFKQVKNLATGESVELEELGIRADRLALETQIGKQKISKVINL